VGDYGYHRLLGCDDMPSGRSMLTVREEPAVSTFRVEDKGNRISISPHWVTSKKTTEAFSQWSWHEIMKYSAA
jgi:hypothetical protein